jgi:hypothetical protein
MVRELVLWKSGVPIFRPSGGKGREQISAKAMSSSWTKDESSYTIGMSMLFKSQSWLLLYTFWVFSE